MHPICLLCLQVHYVRQPRLSAMAPLMHSHTAVTSRCHCSLLTDMSPLALGVDTAFTTAPLQLDIYLQA